MRILFAILVIVSIYIASGQIFASQTDIRTVALIGVACFGLILARLVQAEMHHGGSIKDAFIKKD